MKAPRWPWCGAALLSAAYGLGGLLNGDLPAALSGWLIAGVSGGLAVPQATRWTPVWQALVLGVWLTGAQLTGALGQPRALRWGAALVTGSTGAWALGALASVLETSTRERT